MNPRLFIGLFIVLLIGLLITPSASARLIFELDGPNGLNYIGSESYNFEDLTTGGFTINGTGTLLNVPCAPLCTAGSTRELNVNASNGSASDRAIRVFDARYIGIVNITFITNFTGGGFGVTEASTDNVYDVTRISCESGYIYIYPQATSAGACDTSVPVDIIITQLINTATGNYSVYRNNVFMNSSQTAKSIFSIKNFLITTVVGKSINIDNLSVTGTVLNATAHRVTIYDEITRLAIAADTFVFNGVISQNITNKNVFDIIISNDSTTTLGSLMILNSTTDQDVTFLVLNGTNYQRRFYYNTINQTDAYFTNYSLYLLNSTESTNILLSVQDETGNNLENATVSLKRFYSDVNQYITVAQAKTDSDGKAYVNMQLNTPLYLITVEYQGRVVYSSTPRIFYSTDAVSGLTIQAVIATAYYKPYKNLLNVPVSLFFDNRTKTFNFTWADTTQTVTQGCLRVNRNSPRGRISVADVCTATTTGSLNSGLINTNLTGDYVASGTLYAGTQSYLAASGNKNFASSQTGRSFGKDGLIVVFILLVLMVPLAIFSPSMVIFAAGGVLLLAGFMGLLPVPIMLIFAAIIPLILIAGKVQR